VAAPILKPGQPLKILTLTVQYMASKNYVFFSDLPAVYAPDERPSPEDITNNDRNGANVRGAPRCPPACVADGRRHTPEGAV